MKKIAGKIAIVLIMIMLANMTTSCSSILESIFDNAEKSEADAGGVILIVGVVALLAIIIVPIIVDRMPPTYIIQNDESEAQLAELTEKLDGLPEAQLALAVESINALPEDGIEAFNKTLTSMSETELTFFIKELNCAPESELASSLKSLNSMTESQLGSYVNALQYVNVGVTRDNNFYVGLRFQY